MAVETHTLEDRLDVIERELSDLIAQVARRNALIDQFVSPAMNLQGLLAQLGDAGRTQNAVVGELREMIERELRAMQSALRLAISTEGLDQIAARTN